MPPKNRAIIVLGMHRSGTSAFAGVLSLLGADLGSKLLPASATNRSGYWEHEEVVATHDSLLAALGSRWDDPRRLPAEWWTTEAAAAHREQLREIIERDFAESRLWALKDPRLCKLLPLWIPLLEEVGCEPVWVFLARHPGESIRSLESRQGFPREKSELLWLRYTLDAERETRNLNRVILTYDQLMGDWQGTLERVRRAAGICWARPEAAVGEFLDPSQRHHHGLDTGKISAWARDAYEGLKAGAEGGEMRMRQALDGAGAAFETAEDLYGPWMHVQLAEGRTRHAALREKYQLSKEKLALKSAELKECKGQLRALERSPGGKLARFFTRFKGK